MPMLAAAVATPLRKPLPARAPASVALPRRVELLRLYEQMVLLRQFELAAQARYKAGEMPGFIHLYIGEEAVAVGVCAHLDDSDWITSTHRGHGHALVAGNAQPQPPGGASKACHRQTTTQSVRALAGLAGCGAGDSESP